MPAETYSVNCHGAGLFAGMQCPVGSDVFVLDHQAGVGAWGRVVWEGEPGENGRYVLGLEFTRPRNYWNRTLIPRDWLPYTRTPRPGQAPGTKTRLRSALWNARNLKGVRLRISIPRSTVQSILHLATRLGLRPQRQCRCCGNVERLVFRPRQPDLLCRVCYDWVM